MLMGSFAVAGTVTVDTTVPTTDVITADATGATGYTRAFDSGNAANTNFGRGNTFVTPDNPTGIGWEDITLTIRKNGNQTFVNDTLKLWVFKATEAQWILGDGAAIPGITTADIIDTDLTGIATDDVVVDGESYTIDGTISNGSFLHLDLPSSVALTENTDYIFLLLYEKVEGAAAYFQFTERASTGDTREFQLKTTEVGTPSRTLRHYVQGTSVVPEPATMSLLGLGSLLMLKRRRNA